MRNLFRTDTRCACESRRGAAICGALGFGDDVWATLDAMPDLTVFSSDYPHQEGNADPLGILQPGLDALEDARRAAFLGGNMADCFARTGDPLT